jgi:hypothetical protein
MRHDSDIIGPRSDGHHAANPRLDGFFVSCPLQLRWSQYRNSEECLDESSDQGDIASFDFDVVVMTSDVAGVADEARLLGERLRNRLALLPS